MLAADDPVTWSPRRIAVAGVSGAGKTTLCGELAALLDVPRVELDALFHGPNWIPRETFLDDVAEFTAGPRWVVELQYADARPLILERADTVLWLDYPVVVQMSRLLRRTVRRRLLNKELWNGNREPPLHTVFTEKDHVLRWGWTTRHKYTSVIPHYEAQFPDLTVVRFRSPAETRRWVRSLGTA